MSTSLVLSVGPTEDSFKSTPSVHILSMSSLGSTSSSSEAFDSTPSTPSFHILSMSSLGSTFSSSRAKSQPLSMNASLRLTLVAATLPSFPESPIQAIALPSFSSNREAHITPSELSMASYFSSSSSIYVPSLVRRSFLNHVSFCSIDNFRLTRILREGGFGKVRHDNAYNIPNITFNGICTYKKSCL